VEGFSLARWFSRPSDYQLTSHGHADAHFMFYTGGEYWTEAHGDTASSSQPLIFNPRQTFHRDRPVAGGGSFFTITLLHERRPELAHLDLPGAPSVVLQPSAHRLIHRLARECVADLEPSALELEARCLELAALMERRPIAENHPPRWLGRATELLIEDLDEPASVADIAAAISIHPAHFARTFRRFHGCTPASFRQMVRLRGAATRLSQTRTAIAEIALDCGFADQSHFSKAFKRWTGVSPAAYRRITV
jgi:AraC family transcriptional regulator